MATTPHVPPDTDAELPCPLCTGVSGRVVWHCAAWRVVHADSCAATDVPAFYRLVSNAHHAERTDLPERFWQIGPFFVVRVADQAVKSGKVLLGA